MERSLAAPDAAARRTRLARWTAATQAVAVDRAAFEVEAGSDTRLIGPNGAGKTTAFNLTSDLLRAQGGTIIRPQAPM